MEVLVKPIYIEDDFPDLEQWWKNKNMTILHPTILPAINAMAYRTDNFKKLAAGWLYFSSDCQFAMMEHLISNPENTARESYEGIDKVIGCLVKVFKNSPYTVLMTSCPVNSGLNKMFKKHKLNLGAKDLNHYVIQSNQI